MCVGEVRYRSVSQPLRILEYWFIYGCVSDVVGNILAEHNIHNLWMSHIDTIAGIVAVLMIYSFWIKQRLGNLILYGCLIGFITIWIISKIFFEPFSQMDGLTGSISDIIQIAFSSFILVEVIKDNETQPIM